MLVITRQPFPGQPPASTLPPGGSPADDRAYRDWRERFVADFNARSIDLRTRPRQPIPAAPIVEDGRVDEWLMEQTGASRLLEGWTCNHRLRWLAVQLKADPRRMRRLIERYAAMQAARLEDTNR